MVISKISYKILGYMLFLVHIMSSYVTPDVLEISRKLDWLYKIYV